MFLSDIDIKKAIESGDIVIKDFDESRLQPASYDVLLGNKFVVTESNTTAFIDPVKKIFPDTREIEIKDEETFILHPGVSVLGYSHDFFGSDKYFVEINGKSSLARIGLLVHNSASLINPGHYLNVALELCNLNTVPIILRPKMAIGQLTFSSLSSPVKTQYKKVGRYNANNMLGYLPPLKDKRTGKKG